MLKCQELIANNSWHFKMYEQYLKQEKTSPFSVLFLYMKQEKTPFFGILFVHVHVCAVEISCYVKLKSRYHPCLLPCAFLSQHGLVPWPTDYR